MCLLWFLACVVTFLCPRGVFLILFLFKPLAVPLVTLMYWYLSPFRFALPIQDKCCFVALILFQWSSLLLFKRITIWICFFQLKFCGFSFLQVNTSEFFSCLELRRGSSSHSQPLSCSFCPPFLMYLTALNINSSACLTYYLEGRMEEAGESERRT